MRMDKSSQKELEKAAAGYPEKVLDEPKEITEEEFKRLLEEMQDPVLAQRHLAVNIKVFLDRIIKIESASEKGILSDHTRRWVESYNNILDKIQKALYGDKSVNLHLHKVTHSQIAAKMRDV